MAVKPHFLFSLGIASGAQEKLQRVPLGIDRPVFTNRIVIGTIP
jgi:hypothetical protein